MRGRFVRHLLLCSVLCMWGCSQGFMTRTLMQPTSLAVPDGWQDGSYTGVSDRVGDLPTPQLVRATVDVSQGRIVTIRIHQPPGWQAPQAPELLLRGLLDQQPAEVSTPALGGSEPDPLRRALDDALSRARDASPMSQ